jgi:hypothetical protein
VTGLSIAGTAQLHGRTDCRAGHTSQAPHSQARKNPRANEDITHLPPEQIAADILEPTGVASS